MEQDGKKIAKLIKIDEDLDIHVKQARLNELLKGRDSTLSEFYEQMISKGLRAHQDEVLQVKKPGK